MIFSLWEIRDLNLQWDGIDTGSWVVLGDFTGSILFFLSCWEWELEEMEDEF